MLAGATRAGAWVRSIVLSWFVTSWMMRTIDVSVSRCHVIQPCESFLRQTADTIPWRSFSCAMTLRTRYVSRWCCGRRRGQDTPGGMLSTWRSKHNREHAATFSVADRSLSSSIANPLIPKLAVLPHTSKDVGDGFTSFQIRKTTTFITNGLEYNHQNIIMLRTWHSSLS